MRLVTRTERNSKRVTQLPVRNTSKCSSRTHRFPSWQELKQSRKEGQDNWSAQSMEWTSLNPMARFMASIVSICSYSAIRNAKMRMESWETSGFGHNSFTVMMPPRVRYTVILAIRSSVRLFREGIMFSHIWGQGPCTTISPDLIRAPFQDVSGIFSYEVTCNAALANHMCKYFISFLKTEGFGTNTRIESPTNAAILDVHRHIIMF